MLVRRIAEHAQAGRGRVLLVGAGQVHVRPARAQARRGPGVGAELAHEPDAVEAFGIAYATLQCSELLAGGALAGAAGRTACIMRTHPARRHQPITDEERPVSVYNPMDPDFAFTLGIEEEYQIIDPKTRALQSYITQILEADHLILGQVKPELHQSIVEVGTTVCRTIVGMSAYPSVVTSPATWTRPVVTIVSQATREYLSCARIASRIPSEI